MYSYVGVCRCGCLDDGVEQHHSGLLGDDLLGGEVMLDELRDGGEARPFKAVLTLPEGERDTVQFHLLLTGRRTQHVIY